MAPKNPWYLATGGGEAPGARRTAAHSELAALPRGKQLAALSDFGFGPLMESMREPSGFRKISRGK